MLTLYTAVGTLKFQKTTGGKSIPLVSTMDKNMDYRMTSCCSGAVLPSRF